MDLFKDRNSPNSWIGIFVIYFQFSLLSFVIQQIFSAVIFKEPEQCVRCFIYLPLRYVGRQTVDNVKHVFPSFDLS